MTHTQTYAYAYGSLRARDGGECGSHYDIMGYFDPSRITESTIRDLIRESPLDLALWVFASAFDLEGMKERNFKEGRNEEAMEGE